jgi:flagellar protein FlbT
VRQAIPDSRDLIDAANNHISAGTLYKALKEIRKLIKIEEDQLVSA